MCEDCVAENNFRVSAGLEISPHFALCKKFKRAMSYSIDPGIKSDENT